MKFCEECGAQLEDDVLFCDECGTPVSEDVVATTEEVATAPTGAMKFCEECGAQLAIDEKFCSECGAPVSEDVEEAVDEPVEAPVEVPEEEPVDEVGEIEEVAQEDSVVVTPVIADEETTDEETVAENAVQEETVPVEVVPEEVAPEETTETVQEETSEEAYEEIQEEVLIEEPEEEPVDEPEEIEEVAQEDSVVVTPVIVEEETTKEETVAENTVLEETISEKSVPEEVAPEEITEIVKEVQKRSKPFILIGAGAVILALIVVVVILAIKLGKNGKDGMSLVGTDETTTFDVAENETTTEEVTTEEVTTEEYTEDVEVDYTWYEDFIELVGQISDWPSLSDEEMELYRKDMYEKWYSGNYGIYNDIIIDDDNTLVLRYDLNDSADTDIVFPDVDYTWYEEFIYEVDQGVVWPSGLSEEDLELYKRALYVNWLNKEEFTGITVGTDGKLKTELFYGEPYGIYSISGWYYDFMLIKENDEYYILFNDSNSGLYCEVRDFTDTVNKNVLYHTETPVSIPYDGTAYLTFMTIDQNYCYIKVSAEFTDVYGAGLVDHLVENDEISYAVFDNYDDFYDALY